MLAGQTRCQAGSIELTKNEWSRACNLSDRYCHYVFNECTTPSPRLLRVQNQLRKLMATAEGGVIIDEIKILRAADKNS